MDQIVWRVDLPKPRPIVPYLCEPAPRAICDSVGKLRTWPALMGWDFDSETSIDIAASRCQAWLFFGILQTMTTAIGRRFDVNDFVINIDDRQVVSTAGLSHLLGQVSKKEFPARPKTKASSKPTYCEQLFDELQALLPNAVMWMIKSVCRDEEANPSCNLWKFEYYNVFLSTLLLIENVCDLAIERMTKQEQIARCQCKPWIQFFGYSTRTLRESYQYLGHCPSLFKRVNLSLSTACRVLALPVQSSFSHVDCDLETCKSFNVNQETYKPQHCGHCNRCSILRVDTVILHDIVKRDAIPLIRSTMASNSEVTIELVDGTDMSDFASISHLWAGGLGNLKENAHYQCQLRRIHEDLAELRSSSVLSEKDSTGPIHYWLDSLCIPVVNPVLKKQAINSMARIYAGSKTVLVIDPDLFARRTTDLGLPELDLTVLCSPWMARSWTLQEGALAVNIVFRFVDKLVPLEKLKFSGGQVQHTAIQSLWSRDVNRIMPRAYYDLYIDPTLGLAAILRRTFSRKFGTTKIEKNIENDPDSPDKFLHIWNELSERTTSQHDDIAAIMATFVDRSAGELLDLPQHVRMHAILRTQVKLPAQMLFVPVDDQSPVWSPHVPISGRQDRLLHWTHGAMSFLPSGEFRIDDFKSMYMLRSYEKISIPQMACFHNPVSKSYCSIKFDQKCAAPNTGKTPRDVVLLFDRLARSKTQFSNGRVFELVSANDDGLRVKYLGTFTYKHPGCNEQRHRSGCGARSSDTIKFFEVYRITRTCPLYIDMGVQWPQLKWSRSQFYPFADSSRKVAQMLHLFDQIALAAAIVVVSATYAQVLAAIGSTMYSSTVAMIPLASFAFMSLRSYLSNLEYIYFWRITNSDLQHKWAASFSTQEQILTASMDSKPVFTLKAIVCYTVLLIATFVPTVIMLVHTPAMQVIWTEGVSFANIIKLVVQYYLDSREDGSLHPWYVFITRLACRSVCAELLLRAIIVGLVKLKETLTTRSTYTRVESQASGEFDFTEAAGTRYRAAMLFHRLVFMPCLISFMIVSWASVILFGKVSFAHQSKWITLFEICTLLYSTVATVRLAIGLYKPVTIRVWGVIRSFLLFINEYWNSRASEDHDKEVVRSVELL